MLQLFDHTSGPIGLALHAADRPAHAIHSVVLPDGAAPDWVHLVPAGRFTGADGRGPYTLTDAAAVVAAFKAGGRPLPIDYDHATDLAAPAGRPAPAAGWIEELQARADGIWGRVSWTPAGVQALQNREYRFLSPVFLHGAKDGRVTQVLRAALTNNPNLRQLTALASQHPQQGDRSTMDMEELLRQLRAALGLPDAADLAAIIAAVKDAKDAKATASKLPAIATAAGLAQTADTDAIVAAINAARDPAKFVPADQVTALQNQLTALTTQIGEEKATQAVDRAIKDGKLAPSLRDWGLALHKQNPQAFGDFVAKQPTIVQPGAGGTAGKPSTAEGGLSAEDMAICATLGLSVEDYKKSKGA